MKIYIIDIDEQKMRYVRLYFYDEPAIECVVSDLGEFLKTSEVECVVSPANAYGLMDGGFDLAITTYFGDQLQARVQQYIIDYYWGEQPVGTSFIIDAGKENRRLIHTPTMRTPQMIREPLLIYQCMRTTLMCAIENNVGSVVIPIFGGGCGNLHSKVIAEMMWRAYKQLKEPPGILNWKYAEENEIYMGDYM